MPVDATLVSLDLAVALFELGLGNAQRPGVSLRLLLDTCVWGGARPELEAAGHDVVAAVDWEKDPGDEEILAQAFRERRVHL